MDKFICIDIGGTDIKYALANINGQILEQDKIPTEAKLGGGRGIMQKVCKIVEDYLQNNDAKGIAVSTAGMVHPMSGEIVYALEDAIPNYTGTKIKLILESAFNLPCWVENDVNAAALGEYWLGAAKGVNNIFCITVGTSIGGACMHRGQVIHGSSNSAGEIAYMRIDGKQLHELVSTIKLIENVAAKKGLVAKNLDGKEIFNMALNGDEVAISEIKKMFKYLSTALANVINILNPNAIVLGGAIMANKAYLKPIISEELSKLLVAKVYESTQIEFASLGNNAGMLGALYNFLQKENLL